MSHEFNHANQIYLSEPMMALVGLEKDSSIEYGLYAGFGSFITCYIYNFGHISLINILVITWFKLMNNKLPYSMDLFQISESS